MPRGRRTQRPPRLSARRSLQKRGNFFWDLWSGQGGFASPRLHPPPPSISPRLSPSPSHSMWLSVFAIARRDCTPSCAPRRRVLVHAHDATLSHRSRARARVSQAPMCSAVTRWCPAAMPPQWSCTALHSPRAHKSQPSFCFQIGSAAATQGAHTANGAVPTAPTAATAPDRRAVSLPPPCAPSASAAHGATAARNKPFIAALAKPPPKPQRPRLRGSISEQVHAPCAPAVPSASC